MKQVQKFYSNSEENNGMPESEHLRQVLTQDWTIPFMVNLVCMERYWFRLLKYDSFHSQFGGGWVKNHMKTHGAHIWLCLWVLLRNFNWGRKPHPNVGGTITTAEVLDWLKRREKVTEEMLFSFLCFLLRWSCSQHYACPQHDGLHSPNHEPKLNPSSLSLLLLGTWSEQREKQLIQLIKGVFYKWCLPRKG